MKNNINRAIENICSFGDTDVLGHPLENLIIQDRKTDICNLIMNMHSNFDEHILSQSPSIVNFLTPVGYSGARWISQIDPLWNIYYLASAIEAAPHIEALRLPIERASVFSYRFNSESSDPKLFISDSSFRSYMEACLEQSKKFEYVVQADISDFYGHVRHHRLENALRRALPINSYLSSRLIRLLSGFSKNYSHGLPVGGPASRILSECFLSQVDRLLDLEGIRFCRFADDFTIFATSRQDAIQKFIFLTRILFENEGLTLQKSKNRILSSQEYQSVAQDYLRDDDDDVVNEPAHRRIELARDPRAFMRLSLRYDPYSLTADEDYEALKDELKKFDILGMLTHQLSKSRVDVAFSRKLVSALKFVDDSEKDEAAISLIGNIDLLLPILPSVLLAIDGIEGSLSPKAREKISRELYAVFSEGGYLNEYDGVASFAIRLIAKLRPPEAARVFVRTYNNSTNPIIRRDIILGMTHLDEFAWLSQKRNDFDGASAWERRGIIVSSYWLGDEGSHWRRTLRGKLSPFESIVKSWCESRSQQGNRTVPL